MDCISKVVCLALASMALALAISVKADIDCSQVLSSLEPCISYVQPGSSSSPSSDCCNGVKTIFTNAKSTPDRRKTCECLKSAANDFPTMFDPKRAANLPKACGVNFPYVITPNFDCNSITY